MEYLRPPRLIRQIGRHHWESGKDVLNEKIEAGELTPENSIVVYHSRSLDPELLEWKYTISLYQKDYMCNTYSRKPRSDDWILASSTVLDDDSDFKSSKQQ